MMAIPINLPSPENENEPSVDELKQRLEHPTYKMLKPADLGYVPITTNVPGEMEGSVFQAAIEDTTTWGSFISSPDAQKLSGDKQVSTQEALSMIPDDLVLDYADRYIGRNPKDYDHITNAIRHEIQNDALLSQHPWKTFGYSVALGFTDPVNYLPFGVIYKNIKRGSQLLRGVAQSGLTAAGSAATQEAIIQNNQLTREAQESYINVFAAGITGAALGGIGTGIGIHLNAAKRAEIEARNKVQQEVMDVLTDKDKELTPEGTLKADDLARMPEAIRKSMVLTPMNRLINSRFNISKYIGQQMYENNYTYIKHTQGLTDGASVERLIKGKEQELAKTFLDYQNIYFDMVGIKSGPFKGIRSKLKAPEMSYEAFGDEVSLVLTTERPSPREHVNLAAKLYRENIFNPLKDEAIKLGLLPEDVSVPNAAAYFMIAHNKNKIIEQGGRSARGPGTFPEALYQDFKASQVELERYKQSPEYINANNELTELKEKLNQTNQKRKLSEQQKEKLNERIKTLEKSIVDNAPKRAKNYRGELLKSVDDNMLWTQVEQTVDNILGDNAGQLLNPILTSLKGGSTKPFQTRHILADQESMRQWHITDASKIASMYVRAMVPAIEMSRFAKKMGAKDISEMRTKIGEQILAEYNEQAKGLTGKAAQKLREERDRDISDINTTIDLMLGVYGDGPNVLNSSAKDLYQNFLKWNYTRLLGYMTLSSLPDAGIQVFANGPYRLVHDGLLSMFSQAKKISKRDLRAIGYGLETELGTRIKSYSDHQGLSTNPSPFTKGLDSLTHSFGNLSLMNQWNTLMQNMAGHISINRTLDTIHKVVNGEKVAQKEIERVARLGLAKEHFNTIAKFTKDNISDGTRYADWSNWNITNSSDAEALKQFQLSVGKDIDSIVIVPGLGDRVKIGSLDANTPVGKLLFQFKTFLSSSTNKLLYSGIQRGNDIDVYLGAVSMMALGGLSYITTSLVRGSEPDLSFKNLSHEAIDRSGLLGIWGETANIGSKLLGFGGVSRYQSRDIWGALTGPSGGALSEVLSIMNKVRGVTLNDETLDTKDAEKIARLIPLQNLAYWHYPRRKLVHEGALSLGAKDAGEL